MDSFNTIWTNDPARDQHQEYAKESKASSYLKRHKQNDYRAQDITMDVKAEVIEVERYPLTNRS